MQARKARDREATLRLGRGEGVGHISDTIFGGWGAKVLFLTELFEILKILA